jgi:hypothetical protein
MPKLFKITIELEDKIMTIEGNDAEKWFQHFFAMFQLASDHGMDLFMLDSTRWRSATKADALAAEKVG